MKDRPNHFRGIVIGTALLAVVAGVVATKHFFATKPAATAVPADPIGPRDLVKELVYLKDESLIWYVEFGLESQGKWAPRLTGLAPDGRRVKNRVSPIEMIGIGETFFQEGEFAKRFKFTGFVQRDVVNERTRVTQNVKFAQYEDLRPGRAGRKYESQANLPMAMINESAYHDRTAVMGFRGAKEFKVEEGASFALPPDSPEKPFVLKSVTSQAIEVEFIHADGAKETVAIPKKEVP